MEVGDVVVNQHDKEGIVTEVDDTKVKIAIKGFYHSTDVYDVWKIKEDEK